MESLFKSEEGNSIIEFALILPLLTLIFVGTVDFSLALFRRMQVSAAVDAGAQYAVQNSFDATQIVHAMKAASSFSLDATPAPTEFYACASSSGLTPSSAGTYCPNGYPSQLYVQVSAKASFPALVSYSLLPSSYALATSETIRVQ